MLPSSFGSSRTCSKPSLVMTAREVATTNSLLPSGLSSVQRQVGWRYFLIGGNDGVDDSVYRP